MRLTKAKLQATLDALTEANNRAHIARAKIAEHCKIVYGVDPADIDNDVFIDSCCGGAGISDGMTAEKFELSMLESMEMAGIAVPNAKTQGKADGYPRRPAERT